MPQPSLRVFEDEDFTLDHAEPCAVPGYLILRCKAPVDSLAGLDVATARRLGEMLSSTTRVLEELVGADRVYCLTFAEIDRRLHFHLFPRTPWLLEQFHRATGSGALPINGPALFEWARTTYVQGQTRAVETAVSDICDALRERLNRAGPI